MDLKTEKPLAKMIVYVQKMENYIWLKCYPIIEELFKGQKPPVWVLLATLNILYKHGNAP